MTMGQLVPCIGHRPAPTAHASSSTPASAGCSPPAPATTLAGDGLRAGPQPDRAAARPRARRRTRSAASRPRRTSARTSRSPTSRPSSPTAGPPAPACATRDRIAAVCADLGIGAVKAHNLRRQLTLPEPIRARVAERPGERQLSVTLANRLADMHDVAPELTAAVAAADLHPRAARRRAARPRRVRAPHRRRGRDRLRRADRRRRPARRRTPSSTLARAHLTDAGRAPGRRACSAARPTSSTRELDALQPRRKRRARHAARRRRAARPRRAPAATPTCTTAAPTSPPASGSSTPCSCSTPSARRSPTQRRRAARAEPAYFAGAGLDAPDLRDAAAGRTRAPPRAAPAPAPRPSRTNLGLGHDLRAGLIDPSPAQLDALRAIVCHLLARDYRDVIAYGAGWTDPERQRPVGETGRHEPTADRRDRRRRTRARARRPRPAARHRRARRALRRRVRARPRRRHPHQGARQRAHEPQARTRRCPAATSRCAPRCGRSCARCSRRGWPSCTATRSSIDEAERSTVDLAAHRGDSSLDDLDLRRGARRANCSLHPARPDLSGRANLQGAFSWRRGCPAWRRTSLRTTTAARRAAG